MQFRDTVLRRRIVRNFTPDPVPPEALDDLLTLAMRARTGNEPPILPESARKDCQDEKGKRLNTEVTENTEKRKYGSLSVPSVFSAVSVPPPFSWLRGEP